MGQKVNPHGLRVGVIKNWDSRWFAKDNVFGDTLVEDYKLRNMLLKQLAPAGVPNGSRHGRQEEPAREGAAAVREHPRRLEGDQCSHAVPEQREGAVDLGRDRGGDPARHEVHAAQRWLAEPASAPR